MKAARTNKSGAYAPTTPPRPSAPAPTFVRCGRCASYRVHVLSDIRRLHKGLTLRGWSLTGDGETKANAPESTASTNEELHQIILQNLSTPEALAPILDTHLSDIAREEVTAAAGYEPTSGGFANLLGTLRSMSMIDYLTKDRVNAENILFPMRHEYVNMNRYENMK